MKILISTIGVLIGLLIGLLFAGRYMNVRAGACGLEPASACDLLKFLDDSYTGLAVGDNYGPQITAPMHILEPKVSDAYLQYGGGAMKTGDPQAAGRNTSERR